MDLHGILLLLCAILGFSGRPANAVFGGSETGIEGYPHHVSIEARTNQGYKFIGSGAILSERIVVSVASAVNSYWYHPSDLIVRVGSSKSTSSGTVYGVEDSGLHNSPKYSGHSGDHDLAVLKLKKPISWTSNVRSIRLPSTNARPPYEGTSFVSSWGSYESSSEYSTKLRHAAFRFRCKCYPYVSSSDAWNQTVNDSANANARAQMLCATNPPARGTCKNDDGAPLVAKGVLVGLATRWGFGCDNSLNESLFVDLANWENRYFLEQFL